MPKKRLALVLLVFSEIIAGLFFLFFVHLHFTNKNEIEQEKKVALVSSEFTQLHNSDRFQYYTELRPNLSEKNQPSWLCHEAVYTYNSDGLNDRYDYSLEKDKNVFRIIALGDSFTFGHYVNTEDSWPEQLEDILNQDELNHSEISFEVINLGMRGFDIPYSVERYKRIGQKYSPDLIIWFESGSGFQRYVELLWPIIFSCVDNNEKNAADAISLEKLKIDYQHLVKCWISGEEFLIQKYSQKTIETKLDEFLDEFYLLTENTPTTFILFDSSSLNQVQKERVSYLKNRYKRFSFETIVQELKTEEVLPDGHPSREGHEKIAQSIHHYLISSSSLPSSTCEGDQ